jgi:hypothetical protein
MKRCRKCRKGEHLQDIERKREEKERKGKKKEERGRKGKEKEKMRKWEVKGKINAK